MALYEVRCERCKTSFAPETKRCIHCGGPLGRGRVAQLVGAGVPTGPAGGPGRGSMSTGPVLEQEPDEGAEGLRSRSPMWMVTAAIIMLVSMLRTCMDGGGG